MSRPFGEGSLKMKAIKVKFLTAILIVVLSFSLIDLCHGEKNRQMTASVDVGRAKAKISAEEMLKLHRKRRDENDKLFSINSPRKNDPENQVNRDLFLSTFIEKEKLIVKLHHVKIHNRQVYEITSKKKAQWRK